MSAVTVMIESQTGVCLKKHRYERAFCDIFRKNKRRMMKLLMIIILIVIVLIFLALSVGPYLYVTHPKRYSHEAAENKQRAQGNWGDFDSYTKEPLDITCRDGYLLHGMFVPAEESSNRYVIITHGYTYTSDGSVKYANIFHALGYHVYLYDLRHHGNNQSTYCSMGYHEGQDVVDVYDYFRKKHPDAVIGLHGESLGCASSVIALGERTDIDFLVADCGFADFSILAEELCGQLLHLPKPVTHLASWVSLLLHGFRLDQIRPIDSFAKNKHTPVLFIHGKDDTFIRCRHSEMMYAACQAPKELWLVPGAEHAESCEKDRAGYDRRVREFLNTCL